ncbi:ParA family protein [Paenibacillus apiarius]|uniref:ParA family protein n=1 Tax=Paenibacillus apiarius TaxID=46240 RepID=UPI0019816C49|nr:hypothetical protein [Paenibacillus apiarius]MBN3527466.1 hypothetical protein [Paenibacillus apiarius]
MAKGIFIGACDKSIHLIALATFLTRLERKVLLVDATMTQRLGYYTGLQQKRHISILSWNGIDVMCNTTNWADMEQGLERHGGDLSLYDDVIIDTDRSAFGNAKQWRAADIRFMTHTLERYALYRNIEWLQAVQLHDNGEPLEFISLQLRSVEPDAEAAFIAELYHSGFSHRWIREPIAIVEGEQDWAAQMGHEHEGRFEAASYMRSTKKAWRALTECFTGQLPDKVWRRCLKTGKKGRIRYAAM